MGKQRKNKNPGIYSEGTREDWLRTSPKFNRKELLIRDLQVMQRWEDGYMKSLAAVVTSHGGNTLEVGFGLGISCGYILKSNKIKTHTVIECHPAVIENAHRMYKKDIAKGRLKIVRGFWEKVSPKLKSKSFDSVLFDSCPLELHVEFFQFFPFFKEANRLLKDDGIFTYFSDEAKTISKEHRKQLEKAGLKNIKFKICKVHPPKTCEYWKHNTIITPMIKKF